MGSTCQTWWYSIRVRLSRLRARVGNNFEIVRSGGKKKNIGEKVLNNFQKGEEHSSFYFFEIKNHQLSFQSVYPLYIYIYTYIEILVRSRKTIFIINNIYIYRSKILLLLLLFIQLFLSNRRFPPPHSFVIHRSRSSIRRNGY